MSRLSRSRRGVSLTHSEIATLVDSALKEAYTLAQLSYDESLRYYCSEEEEFHQKAVDALSKATEVLSKLKSLGVTQTPKFERVENEIKKAKQYLTTQYQYLALPDYGSMSKMDPACHDLGYGAI